MNFFNPKFAATPKRPPGQPGMFKPGEVVWNAGTQSYYMAPPACVCFMLHMAFEPDPELSAQRHQHNRASVVAGIALATSRGFTAQQRLVQALESGQAMPAQLRTLSDDMLRFVSPESWLECVFAYTGEPPETMN